MQLLIIILPVFFAGLTFILILKLNILSSLTYPLDFGIRWEGKRLFGENKTFRGPLIMGIFTSIYGYFLSRVVNTSINSDSRILLYFLIVGLAYSLGELPNSFLKRQLNIASGEKAKNKRLKTIFKLTDTFDSLIACGLIYLTLFKFQIPVVISAVLLGGILHLGTDNLMKAFKLK